MKKILLIDDDVVIRITFDKLLKSGDHIVKQAKNVGDAIKALQDEIFDLILLDLKLPPVGWEGGFQILKKKKRLALNSDTPVIIVTGAPSKEFVEKRIDTTNDVIAVLIKPIENEKLLNTVNAALERSTLMRQETNP